MGNTLGIHQWIQAPYFPIKSGKFIKANQIRCGSVKIHASAARGGGRASPLCALDGQHADLNHVLQVCQEHMAYVLIGTMGLSNR